jgi:hypothetical protein
MSFGVGAGDVFSVTMLAWNLYRNCKNSGEEFKRVADDLKNLHVVLKDIEETVEQDNTGLSRTRSERLDKVRSDTRSVLEQLARELESYGNLDTKTQRKWDALRWGMKDVSEIKLRLIAITTNLNAFSSAITKYVASPIYRSWRSRACNHIPFFRANIHPPYISFLTLLRLNLNAGKYISLTFSLWISAAHSRIEKILLKVLDEVTKGYHEGSVLSDGSVDSINTKEAWQQLRMELEEAGIDAAVLNEKRAFIVDLILRAKSDGTIDEVDVPDFDAGSEFDTDLSTTRTLIGEEYENRLERLRSGEEGVVVEHPRSANAQKRPKKRRLGSLFGKLMGNDIRVLEAADAGDLETMLKLIKQKANLQTTDKWDWTALHMAAYGGYDEMTRVLIEEGADLNARTVDDETPRDLAEIKGRVGVVRIIEEEEIRRANKKQNLTL